MTMALTNTNETRDFGIRQARSNLTNAVKEKIHWARVTKLPAFLLLSMVLCSCLIAGHTRYVEMETERLTTQTDQYVVNRLRETSSSSELSN